MRFLSTFIFTLLLSIGFAQTNEIDPPDFIKTITFRSNKQQTLLPLIRLHESFSLEFDVLNTEESDFYYTIEHYDYDWTPSNLLKTEYLNGLDNLRIVDYKNSLNAYQLYSNYKLQIPNSQTQIKVSGNYMIKIFNDYDELVFSRKFMIYEDLANVGVVIKRSRDVRFINERQSVDFKVSPIAMILNNPLENVKSIVVQNNNLKTALANLKPQYTIGKDLIYNYSTATSFDGGNEYFYFENKDLRTANLGVQAVDLKELYHSYLYLSPSRAKQPYTYNPDINGGFQVNVVNGSDPSIEADYSIVHFRLRMKKLISKDVHVYGGFNNFNIEESTNMHYIEKLGYYQVALKLKQGFYNYKFVAVDQNSKLHQGLVSGNFYETENNYKVIVYYRDLGARYDRIIGFGENNSINIRN